MYTLPAQNPSITDIIIIQHRSLPRVPKLITSKSQLARMMYESNWTLCVLRTNQPNYNAEHGQVIHLTRLPSEYDIVETKVLPYSVTNITTYPV